MGNKVTEGELEPITLPRDTLLTQVTFTSDEVTAVCPVTGQPDWYTVKIAFLHQGKSIESKSLKLYLQSFRSEGLFAEVLASKICDAVAQCCDPVNCWVTVSQKSRGGITLDAHAAYPRQTYPVVKGYHAGLGA